jgi:hypothetical protein
VYLLPLDNQQIPCYNDPSSLIKMFYITKYTFDNTVLFWNSRKKNFNYSGGTAYKTYDAADKMRHQIINVYGIKENVFVQTQDDILNNYNDQNSQKKN